MGRASLDQAIFSFPPALPRLRNREEALPDALWFRSHAIRRSIEQVERHLINGCRNSGCDYLPCRAYQQRLGDNPLRKLTPLSARAAALALIGRSQFAPKHCSPTRDLRSGRLEGSRTDTGSFEQLLMASVSLSTRHIKHKCPGIGERVTSLDNINYQITNDLASQPPSQRLTNLARQSCFYVFGNPYRLSLAFDDTWSPELVAILTSGVVRYHIEAARDWSSRQANELFASLNPFGLTAALRWWMGICSDFVFECLCECLEKLQKDKLDDRGHFRVFVICAHALAAFFPLNSLNPPGQDIPPGGTNSTPELYARMFENELANRLATALLRFIVPLQGQVNNARQDVITNLNAFNFQLVSRWNRAMPGPVIEEELPCWNIGRLLTIWSSHIFITDWDHRETLRFSSISARALFALEILTFRSQDTAPTWRTAGFQQYWQLFDRKTRPRFRTLDDYALAKAWLGICPVKYYPPRESPLNADISIPTLRFLWLFPPGMQARSFRAVCFVRMLQAVEQTKLNHALLQYGFGWQRGHTGYPDPRQDWPVIPALLTLLECPSPDWPIGLKTAVSRFLALKVRRSNLLEDAFNQLWHIERRQLLRPFKVQIDSEGEYGHDVGGVAQEFFSLALREAFDPAYGIFIIDEESRMAWFDPKSLEPLYKYELIGLLMGLALHNGFTLPVKMPRVFYQKLFSPVSDFRKLEDITDGWPSLAKGLHSLLYFRGEVEEVFSRTYVFSFSTFDSQSADVDMTDIGRSDPWSPLDAALDSRNTSADAPPVANWNKGQYVQDYIFWLTDKSIRPQFRALATGFHTVIPRDLVRILSPPVLQGLIEGQQVISIDALRASTRYIDYTSQDLVITHFWAECATFDEGRKQDLLRFVTGSDRVPVTGVQGLEFTIQRNGPDSEMLPTAQTCFGRFLLPDYVSMDKLRRKLHVALDNAAGFGNR